MEKRKARIGTRASIKVNLGNYESLEVSKHLEVDIEFADVEELASKSASLDRTITQLLQEQLRSTRETMVAPK